MRIQNILSISILAVLFASCGVSSSDTFHGDHFSGEFKSIVSSEPALFKDAQDQSSVRSYLLENKEEFEGMTYEKAFAIAREKVGELILGNKQSIIKKRKEYNSFKNIIKNLKSEFVFSGDRRSRFGWYTHKDFANSSNPAYSIRNEWREGNKSLFLKAQVRETGNIYMVSGLERFGFNHIKCLVKLSDTIISSKELTGSDFMHNNDNIEVEILKYTESADNGIIKAIAETRSREITITLVNEKEEMLSYELRAQEIHAFQFSYRYSRVMNQMRRIQEDIELLERDLVAHGVIVPKQSK